MPSIDSRGLLLDARVRHAVAPGIERGRMTHVRGIIVHQTGSSTAASTLASYFRPGNGAHFLIDKDGTLYQTASLHQKTHHVENLGQCRLHRGRDRRPGRKREMVSKPILLALALLGTLPARGDSDPYEGGSRYAQPRPYPSLTIKHLGVAETGAWTDAISGDETPSDCSTFKPNAAAARRFFKVARRVSFKVYVHELDASRCFASGELELANGLRAQWHIDKALRGRVRLPDKRNLYFHCARCSVSATPPHASPTPPRKP